MARGKVGDVVFSRLNGQQVSRVRNRNPRNPRTNSQLYQRAVMATVMQAYSAGKEIFDHAFQGESVGAHNMAKFMKLNADKLRSQLASDLSNQPISRENKVGRFVGPASNTPTPYSYIVSDGGYAQTLFAFDAENNVFKIAAPTTNEKVKEYAARLGLIAGDIYTIVAFVPTSTTPAFVGPGEGGIVVNQGINVVYPTQFRFCRLMVKSGLASVTDALATYDQIFEPDPLNKYMTDLTQVAITAELDLGTLANGFQTEFYIVQLLGIQILSVGFFQAPGQILFQLPQVLLMCLLQQRQLLLDVLLQLGILLGVDVLDLLRKSLDLFLRLLALLGKIDHTLHEGLIKIDKAYVCILFHKYLP